MLTANGGAVREDCGPGCERITYAHGDQFAIGNNNFPTPYAAQVFGFTVAEPARVNTVTVTLAAGAPESSGVLGDIDRLTLQYSAAFPGYAFSSSDNSGSAWGGIARPVLSGQDFTEALRNGGNFTILNNYQKRYKSKIWANGSWPYSVSVTVLYTPKHQPVTDWGWTTNESCRVLYNQVIAGGCGGSVQCLGAPALAANGCYQDTGVQVCPGDLEQPPVAVSPFCREVRVTSDCSTINKGPVDCWTDAHGQVQCPNNDGGYDNCKELEDNPNCRFLREACLEGAERDGVCFVKEQTWDCGTLHSIPVLKREQSIKCAGPVRCMGTDCVDPNSEQSADLAKAVAALEAAQIMATDMQCDPGGNCVVFNGERNECKPAVGGIVNCKTPEGVSLGNYLTLIFAFAKLDSAIMGMNKGGAIRGSWEALRQPLTSTWSAVTESFSIVANSLTGATTEAATDAAAQRILAAAKQEVLSKTATWAAQTFRDAAVNVLFSTTNNGAAVVNGAVQGQLQLGGGAAWLGSVMAWAMYAYTIYTVAMILIKIIWTCEKKEFELGAKRELKACHHVGGYCKSKVLGWCIEKRDTYCCFNTPLARILNEQIRPQLGRGWGSPKNPDCKGINVQDFSRVDWSRINLDEWLAILFETSRRGTSPRRKRSTWSV